MAHDASPRIFYSLRVGVGLGNEGARIDLVLQQDMQPPPWHQPWYGTLALPCIHARRAAQ
jgi:hypothetical protein